VVLEQVSGSSMEVVAEIDTRGSQVIELNVFRSPGAEEYTRISFYRNRGYKQPVAGREGHDSLITIDTSHASLAADIWSRAPETAPVYLEEDEPLKLRVFVDQSIVEVFVNGKQCLGVRVYPEREDSVGISLRAQGRDALLTSLDAWQMNNTYR